MSQTKIIIRLLLYMVYIQTSLSFDCFASKQNKNSFFTKKMQMSPYGYQEAISNIDIMTSFRSRTFVRISFHQQLHPKHRYALDIPDLLQVF